MTKEFRTKTGRVLTDADFQTLADEAERGYDVAEFRAVDPARLAELRRLGRTPRIHRFASWLNARLSGGKTPKAPG